MLCGSGWLMSDGYFGLLSVPRSFASLLLAAYWQQAVVPLAGDVIPSLTISPAAVTWGRSWLTG